MTWHDSWCNAVLPDGGTCDCGYYDLEDRVTELEGAVRDLLDVEGDDGNVHNPGCPNAYNEARITVPVTMATGTRPCVFCRARALIAEEAREEDR